MTSHDREFMNRIVTKIAEIDAGEIIAYSGNYDFYERERAIRETNQQAAFARQQAMLAKEQRFIERFKTHAAKAAQVQSRIKALDKIEKIELPKKRQVVKFEFRVPPRSGDQVAVIEDLHKSYGPRVIYDGFSLTIRRGERWAVMGRNGAGKTTLLKMIAGATAPDSGSVRLGASLNMGYFAQQSLDVLNPDLTIIEQLQKDFPQDGIGSLRTLAGRVPVLGRRRGQEDPRALRRREIAPRDGAHALQPAEFSGAGRAHQPPRSGHQGDAGGRAEGLRRHHDLRLARPHVPARPRLARAGTGRRERNGSDAAGLSRLVRRVRAEPGPRGARHSFLTCGALFGRPPGLPTNLFFTRIHS